MSLSTGAGRVVLAVTVLGSGMAAIDATVVGIALPSIGRDFHTNFGALQWVVTGYALTLGAFLLLGGTLGDRLGRRRVFQVGVVWFTVASVGCAVSPGPLFLVVARIVQGVGAALLTPGSLAILEASFAPSERGSAIGAWTGLGGVATAVGPLLGGYLIAAASWRWIFLVNVPLGVVVLVLTARFVPESRDPGAGGRLDLTGAALAVVGLGGVSYGFIAGPEQGWEDPWVLAGLVGGTVAAAGFVVHEQRTTSPMLPLSFLRIRRFGVANVVTLFVYAALGGALFLLPTALQVVGGYSTFASGAALLPLTAVMLLFSTPSGHLASRIGPRLQMSAGPVLAGVGLALLARLPSDHSYVTGVLPAVLVLGFGLATTVAPLTTTALGALPPEHAGLASAFNNDVARVGGLLAVALLPALAGLGGESYRHPAVFAGGFRTAMWIAGGWCVAGGLIALVGLERLRIRRAAAVRPPAVRPPAVRPAGTRGPLVPATGRIHCALDATPLCGERVEPRGSPSGFPGRA